MRHVPTRWLSTLVEKLIKVWPAIKTYFIQKGEDYCHKIIWDFVKSQDNKISDDLNPEISVAECYLYFIHHITYLFQKYILILEQANILCCKLHEVVINIKNYLETRIRDKLFGAKVRNTLKHFSSVDQKILKEIFCVYIILSKKNGTLMIVLHLKNNT